MKKLLISCVVAVLCIGVPVVYADDTYHSPQGSAGDSGVADARMGQAKECMKQAQSIMGKLREAKDPAARQRLMQEHT